MNSRMLQECLFPCLCLGEEKIAMALSPTSDLDVYEDEKSFGVEAALPGLNRDEVNVIFHQGVLTIQGSKKEEAEDQKRKYHQKSNRDFIYRTALPDTIDENEAPKAEFKNGIVKILFHKQKKAEPKRIPIS